MLYRTSDTHRIVDILKNNVLEDTLRSPYRRDYCRVIHSPSFRRLQGKTQVFPCTESDFFRNRLTHSLEVAQIAKDIATRLNTADPFFRILKNNINLDIVETASLMHDLGHPPFGHNGERALDDCMKQNGGFEGNAQTLRIVSKLEKRQKESFKNSGFTINGKDERYGLNLTFRTLASIIKYDKEIPANRKKAEGIVKGYYASEADLVSGIKKEITAGKVYTGGFKTIECQIMDIADDIAYSTYDLEDAFKANFLSLLKCLSVDYSTAVYIGEQLSKKNSMGRKYSVNEVCKILNDLFKPYILENFRDIYNLDNDVGLIKAIADTYRLNSSYSADGYLRSIITSNFVAEFIQGIVVTPNVEIPALSKICFKPEIKEKVEVLKNLTYKEIISSYLLKVPEYRGYGIVEFIFKALSKKDGYTLLPDDYRIIYDVATAAERPRILCDFIAGMTDNYVLEFYGRLNSENPQTIFKPI